MRNGLAALVGLGFLSALPAGAATGLKVECAARDLPGGAHVWIEVVPEYGQTVMPPGTREVAAAQAAKGESVWRFDVPAGGNVTPIAHEFSFPVDIARTGGDRLGSIHLKARFRVDVPSGKDLPGAGEIQEATLAMPVPAGSAPLTRCVRLRAVGERLMLETAADCQDTSFGKRIHSHPQ